jgi:Holliday junction resolvase-like predicted endonuclease
MGKTNYRKIGDEGEKIAQAWVLKKGWNIITTNFRRRGFEIDIVVLDDKKVLRFIEVKNIVDGNCIYGAESVYKRNMANYYKGIDSFLLYYNGLVNYEKSMDVIIVNNGEILYYENVSKEFVS